MRKMTTRDNPTFSLPFACYSVGHYAEERGWCSKNAGIQNKFVQMIWGISGFGEITLFGQKIPVHPGDIVYYLPGEDHEYTALSRWEYRWITFDGPLAAATMLSYEYPRHIENAGKCPEELFQRIERLLPEATKFNMRHISALILELIALAGGQNSPTSSRTQVVEHFLELVKHNFTDASLNINALAEMLGVHRSTLARLFTKQMKRTPHNYLMSLRAQYGLTLLSGTDLPVSEIAVRCGIPEKTHFCTVIRKSVEMSPTEYRLSQKH